MNSEVKQRGIEIENGVKEKCPSCGSVFRITNGEETLYRNITLLHFGAGGVTQVKCKQCKNIIGITDGGGAIVVE